MLRFIRFYLLIAATMPVFSCRQVSEGSKTKETTMNISRDVHFISPEDTTVCVSGFDVNLDLNSPQGGGYLSGACPESTNVLLKCEIYKSEYSKATYQYIVYKEGKGPNNKEIYRNVNQAENICRNTTGNIML